MSPSSLVGAAPTPSRSHRPRATDCLPVKHRLDYGGNRRINSALYIASVTQHRDLDDARRYINRKIAEGKTRREARRAHKRHLANRVIRRMWKDESERREQPVIIAA